MSWLDRDIYLMRSTELNLYLQDMNSNKQLFTFCIYIAILNDFLCIAILAGVINFLPHPNPPLESGERVRNSHKI
jgi:hypothetical protein